MERVFTASGASRSGSISLGGTLSGGEQQMLATAPRPHESATLLLLTSVQGSGPIMVEEIFRIQVKEINAQGTSILLVEQNALMALQVASRAYVLETDASSWRGPPGSFARVRV